MSRYYAAMREKSDWGTLLPPPLAQPTATDERSSEYLDLITGLFRRPSATALIGSTPGEDVTGVCDQIASELGSSGRRVIIVQIDLLLRMNPIIPPDETIIARKAPNVWLWPSQPAPLMELFRSRPFAVKGNWLDILRGNYDSVILNCPGVEATLGVVDVAAMADATVLVVQAGGASKREIQRTQRELQLKHAKLAGCILIRRW